MKHLIYINDKNRYILENLSEVDLLNPFYFDVVIKNEDDLLIFFDRINLDLLKDFEKNKDYEAPLSIALNLSNSFINDNKKIFIKKKNVIIEEEEQFLFSLVRTLINNQKDSSKIISIRNINRLLKTRDYKGLIDNLSLINKKNFQNKPFSFVILFLNRLDVLKYLKINSLPAFKYSSTNVINTKILTSLNDNETYLEMFLKAVSNSKFSFNFYKTINNIDIKNDNYDNFLNLIIKGIHFQIDCFIFEDEDDFNEFINNMNLINKKVFYYSPLKKKLLNYLLKVLKVILNKDDKEDLDFLRLLSKDKILKFLKNFHSFNAYDFLNKLNEEVNLFNLYSDTDDKMLLNTLLTFLKKKALNIERFYFFITFLLAIRFKKEINEVANIKAIKLDDLHLLNLNNLIVGFISTKKKKNYNNEVMYKSIILKNYIFFNEILKKSKLIYFYQYDSYSSIELLASHLDEVSLFFDLVKYL